MMSFKGNTRYAVAVLRIILTTEVHADPMLRSRYLLGEGAIVQTGGNKDGSVNVQIAQTLIGDATTCSGDSADVFFAVYPDSNNNLYCGFFHRNTDVCFTSTLTIPCDPSTKTASVDLYVKDSSYPGTYQTDNPNVGHCHAGNDNKIKRAVKISKVFECAPPGACTATQDNCLEGTYCNPIDKGFECKAFADIGSTCGGYTISEDDFQCNPEESYCFFQDACQIPDASGVCVAYKGTCTKDSDCDTNEYCDAEVLKCKDKLDLDVCCSQQDDQCQDGMYCNFTQEGGPRCTAYVGIGELCEGYTEPGMEGRCHPDEAYCFYSHDCEIADKPGTCTPLLGDCNSQQDCQPDEYCDDSIQAFKCKARLPEGTCCYLGKDLCLGGLICMEAEYDPHGPTRDFGTKCRPMA